MGFGGEVDDILRALHRFAYSLLVAHIAVNENKARVALHRREVLAPARVGQRIQHAHFVVGVLRQEVLGEVAADEPSTARNYHRFAHANRIPALAHRYLARKLL